MSTINDDPEMDLIKDRTCNFNQLYTDKSKQDHKYTGKAYKCEDCHLVGCKDCILQDSWEERCRDGVFLCYPCYRRYQIRMDIG